MAHLHLFGTGHLVLIAARIARSHGWGCSLRTSNRLWNPDSLLAKDADSFGLDVVVCDSLDEAMKRGAPVKQGDIAFSFGAPWIFKKDWVKLWGGRAYNTHARKLPEFRGGGGASWLIMMDVQSGATAIHELTAGIDDGAIVAMKKFSYPESAKLPKDFEEKDSQETASLLEEVLSNLLKGQTLPGKPQDEQLATYWPRLSTDVHGWVDWDWTAEELARFCNAFDDPFGGAKTFLRGSQVSLKQVKVYDSTDFHPFQRGLIFRVTPNGVYIAAKGGAIFCAKVVLTQDKAAPRAGDRFFTPRWVLERALASRVQYLPDGAVKTELAGEFEKEAGND